MAADAGGGGDRLVQHELDGVFRIVHQAEHADGAGRDVQIFLHIRRVRKRQPCHAQLPGKILRLEYLFALQHQQIKLRLLPVAEE